MNLAETLKNLRVENNLTQKQLGEILKIGQATVACYESGLREPHISSLIAYADFFECSLDFLAGRSDDFGNIILNKSSAQSLTLDEAELIKNFRSLSVNGRAKLTGYVDGLLNK